MIDKKTWLNNLLEELKILADYKFQERVWVEGKALAEREKWSSWVETMCGIFDDCFFNDLLDKAWNQFTLSKGLHSKLNKLRTALNDFQEPPEPYTHKDIVYHPNWYPITLLAKDALEQLEKEMEGRDFEGMVEY